MSDVDVAMDIAKYLNANETSDFQWLKMQSDPDDPTGTLYVHDLPPSPDEAAGVLRYEGGPPSETFSNPVHTRHPRVQITVRHAWSEVALSRAGLIMKYLAQVKNVVINGTEYERIKPVGEPFELGPDSSNRQRAVVNFEVSFYDSI